MRLLLYMGKGRVFLVIVADFSGVWDCFLKKKKKGLELEEKCLSRSKNFLTQSKNRLIVPNPFFKKIYFSMYQYVQYTIFILIPIFKVIFPYSILIYNETQP